MTKAVHPNRRRLVSLGGNRIKSFMLLSKKKRKEMEAPYDSRDITAQRNTT
ncbi:MAG: hypothetical protein QHI48_12670 [Bacteroidota bacterium]|nr:hypothetical protein [Bacteroidota bacterium]